MQLDQPQDGTRVAAWLGDKLVERKSFYRQRETQWREDRALLLQAYRRQIPDLPQLMSAEPRPQMRLALDIMTHREPRFTVSVHDQEPEEQDRMKIAKRVRCDRMRSFYTEASQGSQRGHSQGPPDSLDRSTLASRSSSETSKRTKGRPPRTVCRRLRTSGTKS